MDSMPAKWAKLNFLIIIVFLQLMIYFSVFLDIPVARQVLGFFYLTFIPGFIILKLLKLNYFGKFETISLLLGLALHFETAFINVSSNVLMALIFKGRALVI